MKITVFNAMMRLSGEMGRNIETRSSGGQIRRSDKAASREIS